MNKYVFQAFVKGDRFLPDQTFTMYFESEKSLDEIQSIIDHSKDELTENKKDLIVIKFPVGQVYMLSTCDLKYSVLTTMETWYKRYTMTANFDRSVIQHIDSN